MPTIHELTSGLTIAFIVYILGWGVKNLRILWKAATQIETIKARWKILISTRSKFYYLESVKFQIAPLHSHGLVSLLFGLGSFAYCFLMGFESVKNPWMGYLQYPALALSALFLFFFSCFNVRADALEKLVNELFEEVVIEAEVVKQAPAK